VRRRSVVRSRCGLEQRRSAGIRNLGLRYQRDLPSSWASLIFLAFRNGLPGQFRKLTRTHPPPSTMRFARRFFFFFFFFFFFSF